MSTQRTMNWSAELIKVKSSISNVIFPEIKCPRGIPRNKMYRPDSAIIQISSSATKVCSIYPLRHTAVFPGHWTDAGADNFARDAAAALYFMSASCTIFLILPLACIASIPTGKSLSICAGLRGDSIYIKRRLCTYYYLVRGRIIKP